MQSRSIIITFGLLAIGAATIAAQRNEAPATQARFDGPNLGPGGYMTQRRLAGSEMSLASIDRASLKARALNEEALRNPATRGDAGWQFVGPVNIGGRVLDIAVDPVLADTIFVASASGGVWRSNDAGDTFVSVWPNSNAQPIGALAMASDGTLYAGTGESSPGGGSPTYGNDGVFKSTDRGLSWTNIGLPDSERISRVIIDPNNEQRLFVAATGPLYAPGGERGVYRSVDGGTTWTLVLAGDNDTTGASDVFIDPANSNRMYASMWDHLRQPSLRRYGGVGSGLYRSLDGGDTWMRLTTDLPPVDADIGRIALGMSPSNANHLYAIYLNTIGQFTGMFESTNGGDNWTLMPFNPDVASSQSVFGWWFARIWIDPLNDASVWVAGVPLVRSPDGGVTWTPDFSLHVDHHALAWDPNVPGRVYSGNDGGVYRSDTGGGPDSWTFATVQPYTQFYTMDVDEQLPDRLLGGTQDNRCLRSFTAANPDEWNTWACGDGLENLVNPTDSNLLYGCSQYGNCVRSLDAGETNIPIGETISTRRNWLTPLVFDPNDPSVMYYAGDQVNRSTDGGDTWTAISLDLTGGDPFPTPIDIYPFGTISALAVARTDANRIYVGTDDARLWVTQDQGTTWTRVTDPGLPDRWVTKIVVDEFNADVAYVSYSGFRNDDNTPYVFRTDDGGTNWTDVTGNLPPAPVNTLALRIDGTLYAGSDVGVYRTTDGGASWEGFANSSLPQVPINDIRIHEPSRSIYVATFGRGIYQNILNSLDFDGDGVLNFQDNCSDSANPDQLDGDGDLYGNACDADFNNDCVVNVVDLGLMREAFFSSNAAFDLNGDGVVNVVDLGLLRNLFFSTPGPSGLTDVCD